MSRKPQSEKNSVKTPRSSKFELNRRTDIRNLEKQKDRHDDAEDLSFCRKCP